MKRPAAPYSLTSDDVERLDNIRTILCDADPWDREHLKTIVMAFASSVGETISDIARPLRVALTWSTVSPPIFEVMEILGRDETIARIGYCIREWRMKGRAPTLQEAIGAWYV